MELKRYVVLLGRWLWLILLATGIAAGTSYLATRQMPRVYQASTTLMVGQILQNPNPSTDLLNVSQQLAQTYAQIVTSDPFLQNALDDLGIPIATDRLRDQVNARSIPGTSLIEIRVVDTDPLRAQAIANELGQQVILASPTAREQNDPQREFVKNQADEIRRNLDEAPPRIKDLQDSIRQTQDLLEIEDKQKQINTLQSQISAWQQSYAGFLNYLAPRATNYISVINPARLPATSFAPNVPLYVFSSGAIGLILAVCGIIIIEHVEERKKMP